MSGPPDDPLAWMRVGVDLFLDAAGQLNEDAARRPTRLPGWSRKHILAHVHYNAEALRRLVFWARTGVETRMYADAAQRSAEIDNGATLGLDELLGLVRASQDALSDEMDALPDDAWSHEVVTAQGRIVPATEVPWMRAREVAVHAVDLDTSVTFADLPEDFTVALSVEIVRKRSLAGEGPALAEWLTGRTTAPTLAAWL